MGNPSSGRETLFLPQGAEDESDDSRAGQRCHGLLLEGPFHKRLELARGVLCLLGVFPGLLADPGGRVLRRSPRSLSLSVAASAGSCGRFEAAPVPLV
jgi:hypothetical protein